MFVPYSIRAISSRPPPPSDASRQPKCAYFSRNWGLSANSDWLAEGVRPPSCARVSRPRHNARSKGLPFAPRGGVSQAQWDECPQLQMLPVLRTRTIRPTVFAGGTNPGLTKIRRCAYFASAISGGQGAVTTWLPGAMTRPARHGACPARRRIIGDQVIRD